jgi:hypothetical protein
MAWPRPRENALASMRLLLVSGAAGFAPTLIYVAVSLRYLHDAFPLVMCGAAVGLHSLLASGHRGWVRAAVPALVLIGLYTCLVSVVIATAHERW